MFSVGQPWPVCVSLNGGMGRVCTQLVIACAALTAKKEEEEEKKAS